LTKGILEAEWFVVDTRDGWFTIATSPYADKMRRGYSVAHVSGWTGPEVNEMMRAFAERIVADHAEVKALRARVAELEQTMRAF
jgi:hypothetical protein